MNFEEALALDTQNNSIKEQLEKTQKAIKDAEEKEKTQKKAKDLYVKAVRSFNDEKMQSAYKYINSSIQTHDTP